VRRATRSWPLVWAYRPLLDWALAHRVLTLGLALLVLAGALALTPRIGKEFMPPLNEGDLMFMPITDPAISLPQAIEITRKQNLAVQSVPEVASVVAKVSRADTSTDPAPINMTETVVHLKPESQWRAGMTRERIIGELDAAATMPGVSNIWTQPIINRINMLTTARVPASTAHRRVQLHGDDEAGTHHFPFGPRGSTVSVTG
jgi:Cu(I)/Ag(I) efflux system membrane protein CusA/SilA